MASRSRTRFRFTQREVPHSAQRPSVNREQLFTIGLFVLPGALVYVLFLIWPMFQAGYYSLYDWNGLGPLTDFYGLGNYERAFGHSVFQTAIVNSLIYLTPIAENYSWFGADAWQVEQSNRLLRFFYDLGINRYNSRFLIDGTPASPQHRSLGHIAMNAVAALAADDPIRLEFVQAFWDADLNVGQYRYYDNLLYMLALLHLSGQFKAYAPA